MNSHTFIRWMHRLFSALFYGILIVVTGIPLVTYYTWANTNESSTWTMSIPTYLEATIKPETQSVYAKTWKKPYNWEYSLSHSSHVELSKTQKDGYYLTFHPESWQEFTQLPVSILLTSLVGFLRVFLLLWVLYNFMRLFCDLKQQVVFSGRQIQNVKFIGWGFVWYGVSEPVINYFSCKAAVCFLESQQFSIDPIYNYDTNLPGWSIWVITGLSVLALEQVFHYGFMLKEEHDLTV